MKVGFQDRERMERKGEETQIKYRLDFYQLG